MSAYLSEEEVEYRERDGNGEYKEGEGEGEGDEAPGSSDNDYRPFIFPKICSMNDFFSKILDDVFGKLRPCFQIPKDISLRMAGRREKCYSG